MPKKKLQKNPSQTSILNYFNKSPSPTTSNTSFEESNEKDKYEADSIEEEEETEEIPSRRSRRSKPEVVSSKTKRKRSSSSSCDFIPTPAISKKSRSPSTPKRTSKKKPVLKRGKLSSGRTKLRKSSTTPTRQSNESDSDLEVIEVSGTDVEDVEEILSPVDTKDNTVDQSQISDVVDDYNSQKENRKNEDEKNKNESDNEVLEIQQTESNGIRRSNRIQKIQEEKALQVKEMKDRIEKKCQLISSDEDSVVVESSDGCEASSSNDEASEPRTRRKSSKKKTYTKAGVKLAPIFLSRKEREKKKKSTISEATKNFLYSGVPEVIVKAQKIIELKKVETEIYETLDIFPTFTHNIKLDPMPLVDFDTIPFQVARNHNEDEDVNNQLKMGLPIGESCKVNYQDKMGDFCCGINRYKASDKLYQIWKDMKEAKDSEEPLPWVEKYRVKRLSHLIVEKGALTKFQQWLRQWGRDIHDDGGTSRKYIEKKRKKRDSDSDFIDNDDGNEELKSKSVVLTGPSGCGKTAMVYVLSKRLGFKIVEVNFSSRRAGHEVLRSVEEATLSRSLSSVATVDAKHCLLLFKDIDQYHPEEDEGFYSALAQLITASCRPIVMTMTDPSFVIDIKIEKKDPLWISIDKPLPSIIVSKILLPIIEFEIEKQDPLYELDNEPEDSGFIHTILESLVRHSNCDIKKSMNQTQLLWSSTSFSLSQVHQHLNPKFDFEFVTCKTQAYQIDKNISPTQQIMDEIAQNLEYMTDLDKITFSTLPNPEEDSLPLNLHTYFESNFFSILEKYKDKDNENENIGQFLRAFTLETDGCKERYEKSVKLYDEIVNTYLEEFENYDGVATVRSIVKASVMNSIGTKRHGRVQSYFQRLRKDDIKRYTDNFDFQHIPITVGKKSRTDDSE